MNSFYNYINIILYNKFNNCFSNIYLYILFKKN